jgi:hypothetical protein
MFLNKSEPVKKDTIVGPMEDKSGTLVSMAIEDHSGTLVSMAMEENSGTIVSMAMEDNSATLSWLWKTIMGP